MCLSSKTGGLMSPSPGSIVDFSECVTGRCCILQDDGIDSFTLWGDFYSAACTLAQTYLKIMSAQGCTKFSCLVSVALLHLAALSPCYLAFLNLSSSSWQPLLPIHLIKNSTLRSNLCKVTWTDGTRTPGLLIRNLMIDRVKGQSSHSRVFFFNTLIKKCLKK